MILTFHDHDGDPVAVDSSSIVGLSVGQMGDTTMTIIATVGGSFKVVESFEGVMAAWSIARQVQDSRGATVERWPQHPAIDYSLPPRPGEGSGL